MSARTPIETVKPAFNFDPVEDPDNTESPQNEREAFKAKTAEAFGKADYVPPNEKAAQKRAVKTRTAKKPSTKPSVEKLPFRRPRGRPPGQRQHSLSVKTTEDHLAFLYGVAGRGELVGVLEAALEALAREVIEAGAYQGRTLEKEVLDRAKALAGS
jgi:hypothetical protein